MQHTNAMGAIHWFLNVFLHSGEQLQNQLQNGVAGRKTQKLVFIMRYPTPA